MEKIGIIICGICGKMGSLILKLASEMGEFVIKGGIERKDHPEIGKEIIPGVIISDNLDSISNGKEVIVDFTTPEATVEFVKIAVKKGNKMVIGTTGFSEEQMDFIKESSQKIPILISPNMSYGVNCLFKIVKFAAEILKGYETEIIEIHHHYKKDSPSGTAKKIAEIICKSRNYPCEEVLKYGRFGKTEKRRKEEIGMHSVRIGDIVGEHTVLFGGKGEVIEITHRSYNRETFAIGALEAVKFIYKKEKGLYGMEEVINGGE